MTLIRAATLADWPYIESLRRKEWFSLGFIPKGAYLSVLSRQPVDGRRRWEYQRLVVSEDNGDLTGFCYSSFAQQEAHIIQMVVQEDARRWARATLLEGDVRQRAVELGKCGVVCRVACDLESNLYWLALGYTRIEAAFSEWRNQASKSGRLVWRYRRDLLLPLFGG